MRLIVNRRRSPCHPNPLCGRLGGLFVYFVWCLVLSAGIARASELRRSPIVQAIEEAAPSIVNIHGRKTVRGEQSDLASGAAEREVNGMGTGMIIDERGYILTNFHVVDGVANIQVTLQNEETVIGRVIGHDSKTDLAVLKIEVSRELPVIRVGTSSDLMVGESVVAVGNAFGYQHTVTRGIISALHRSVQVSDVQKYQNLIQTDASINPGNSGGPLMNVDGDVVAVNVAVRVGAQGIGFAIPIDEAMEIASHLVNCERTDRVTHGVQLKTEWVGTAPRCLVSALQKDGPGEASGLRPGDLVRAVEQRPVQRSLDFQRAFLGRKAGDEVEVTVERSGQSLIVPVTLAEAVDPQPTINVRAWELLGVRLAPVPTTSFRQASTRYRGGLKIVSVRPTGPAAKQGIRPGDILVGIHKWETVTLENVAYIMGSEELPENQPVKFFIVREGETLFGTIRLTMNPRN